ncbi:MAG: RNA polymerase subunit sigma-70, partial [Acidobacteriaceae bacterium]
VRGGGEFAGGAVHRQRRVVDAFLTALRAGDVQGLVTLLDPDFSVRADGAVGLPPGVSIEEIHGAEAWAKQAVQAAKGARFARPALVDGSVGVVVAPKGRLVRVLRLTFAGDRIAQMEVIGDAERLKQLDIAALEN